MKIKRHLSALYGLVENLPFKKSLKAERKCEEKKPGRTVTWSQQRWSRCSYWKGRKTRKACNSVLPLRILNDDFYLPLTNVKILWILKGKRYQKWDTKTTCKKFILHSFCFCTTGAILCDLLKRLWRFILEKSMPGFQGELEYFESNLNSLLTFLSMKHDLMW